LKNQAAGDPRIGWQAAADADGLPPLGERTGLGFVRCRGRPAAGD